MSPDDAVKAIVDVIDLCKELQVKLSAVQMERDELDAEVSDYRDSTRWIPVTERMPEYHKECLVFYLARGLMFKAEYSHDGWCDASGEISDELLENVTHWMMLPEPPEVTK